MVVVVLLSALACGIAASNETKAPAAQAEKIQQKLCPVMGLDIDKDVYVDYKDRRVYLCCAMCRKKFAADPEKYIAKLDQQLKEASDKDSPKTGHSKHKRDGHHK